jgi:signal peptidase I
MEKKAKEPFLAVLLSLILPGAGHVYAGKIKKGFFFFLALVFLKLCFTVYFLNPSIKLSNLLYAFILIATAFWVFVIIDSYLTAKKHNDSQQLTVSLRPSKRILFSAGILIVFIAYFLAGWFITRNILWFYEAHPDEMEPTVYKDDRVFVSLLAYKKSPPERGDIVLYRYPQEPSKIHMHRIIGFPGESVLLKDHLIFINGEQLEEKWAVKVRHYNAGKLARRKMPAVVVPQDSYYVLGDNAARSQDSRFWGCIPKSNLIGKVFKRYYPFNRSGPID